ncbi:MAG: replicative DNA helicase [Nitrospira sp.]
MSDAQLFPTLPPHSEEIEMAVLGALLLGGSFDDVAEVVSEEDWYFRRNQQIFAAMKRVAGRNDTIEPLAVSNELESAGVIREIGGLAYLNELSLAVPSASNIQTHIRMVKELSVLRALRDIGREILTRSEEKKSSELIAIEAERRLYNACWARQVRVWQSHMDVIHETLNHIEMMQCRGERISGITTGLIALDRMLGGWQQSDLVVMAARPSMGKTSLMCQAAMAAARAGSNVAIVSLEMSRRQLVMRMVAIDAGVDLFALNNGQLSDDEKRRVATSAMSLSNLPIHYDDSGMLNIDRLRAKVRQLRVKKQVDILFLDYLQLMEGVRKRDGRQVEVSEISRGLKSLAKELEVTVVTLSQLSRECEKRESKRPILSDLRESGSIEQDADIVLMLYRDEVYHEESLDKGLAEILVRKHRNGPTGELRLGFVKQYVRFEDLES